MKISLSSRAKTELSQHRDAIAAALQAYDAADSSLPKLILDEVSLNDAVASIETGTSYTDESGVRTLETKRSQLAMVRGKIERASEDLVPLMQAIHEQLRALHNSDALPNALKPAEAVLKAEIVAQLLPLCGTMDGVNRLLGNIPKLNAFHQFYFRRYFGNNTDAAAEARRSLPVLDAVLAGENLWQWKVEAPADGIADL